MCGCTSGRPTTCASNRAPACSTVCAPSGWTRLGCVYAIWVLCDNWGCVYAEVWHHAGPVHEGRASVAASAGQRGGRQLHVRQRAAVDVPHRRPVEGFARLLRQVDHRLPAVQPLVRERRDRAPVRRPAGGADHRRRGPGARVGLHEREGPPARGRRPGKRGAAVRRGLPGRAERQSSRGIRQRVDARRNPFESGQRARRGPRAPLHGRARRVHGRQAAHGPRPRRAIPPVCWPSRSA